MLCSVEHGFKDLSLLLFRDVNYWVRNEMNWRKVWREFYRCPSHEKLCKKLVKLPTYLKLWEIWNATDDYGTT